VYLLLHHTSAVSIVAFRLRITAPPLLNVLLALSISLTCEVRGLLSNLSHCVGRLRVKIFRAALGLPRLSALLRLGVPSRCTSTRSAIGKAVLPW
jgi:hypothetical protein